MKKCLLLTLVTAFALPPGVALAEQQSLVGEITPTKLDKKKFKNAALFVEQITALNDEAGQNPDQPPVSKTIDVGLPKNIRIDTDAVPHCKVTEAELANQTPEQAKSSCGAASIVSVAGADKTSAEVLVDPNPGVAGTTPLVVVPEVVVFNGHDDDSVIFFTRADAVNTTTVFTGRIAKGTAPYGSVLKITAPFLAAGATSEFRVTIKNDAFVTARCKSKKMPFRMRTTYEDHAPVESTYTSNCQQKKSGKK